jgi:ectoine hydroxylase
MASPRALNACIFLDDALEVNAPILLIPGSHRGGLIPVAARDSGGMAGRTARLKYVVDDEVVTRLAGEEGIVAATGKRGTVLLFDPNVVHASTRNITPLARSMIIIAYNSVENSLPLRETQRPEFLVERTTVPLVASPDDALRRRPPTTSS